MTVAAVAIYHDYSYTMAIPIMIIYHDVTSFTMVFPQLLGVPCGPCLFVEVFVADVTHSQTWTKGAQGGARFSADVGQQDLPGVVNAGDALVRLVDKWDFLQLG